MAITSALSPDNNTLIQMILPTDRKPERRFLQVGLKLR